MRTYPGVQIGVFKDPEEREQIKVLDNMLRHVSAALAKSIFPGQTPAANPTPPPGGGGGGSGNALPTPQRGDLLFCATAGTWSRLSIGPATALLASSGNEPIWTTTPALLLNYLYLPGRVGGQTLTWIDATAPAFTINGGSGFTGGSTFVNFREFNGLGLQLKNALGNNSTAIITGNLEITNNGGSLFIKPNSATVDITIGAASYINSTAAITAPLRAIGRVSVTNTATPVTNSPVATTPADYWVTIQVSVRTINSGGSVRLTLNWTHNGAQTFSLNVPLDTATQQNRMIALTVGSGTLTYTTVYTGVSVGRVDIKIKAQEMTA